MSGRSTRLAAALLGWSLLAMGPLEANDEDVQAGMSAYQRGEYDVAAQAFERAVKKLPRDPRVHLDHGAALYKAGRLDDAERAFRRAEELDTDGSLKNKLLYDRATLAAARGQKEQAVRLYRQALRADPNDELSRHNLEVLLRDLPPPQPPVQGPDGGTSDAGSDGGRSDAGMDGGRPDAGGDGGRPDGGADGGSSRDGGGDAGLDGGPGAGGDGGSDGGRGDGGFGQQESSAPDAGQQPQASDGGQGDGGVDAQQQQDVEARAAQLLDGGMSPEEARRLLDSIKNSEKNLQLWRFRQKTQRKSTDGKDW